jgi:hypothetical protein
MAAPIYEGAFPKNPLKNFGIENPSDRNLGGTTTSISPWS